MAKLYGENITLVGLEEVKKLFNDIESNLTEKRLKKYFYAAGRVVVRKARQRVRFTGQILSTAKKDIGVFSDGKRVKVGLLFKDYSINGKTQKVAPIVRHMTQGFKQTNRKGRGKVKALGDDFVLNAFNSNKQEVIDAMARPIRAEMKRIAKRKKGIIIT